MRKLIFVAFVQHIICCAFSQSITERLSLATKTLEADSQCEHGIISLHVLNSKTGDVIFSRNAGIGLAPASCQKIITSVSAFELLGKDYKYKTTLAYEGNVNDGVLSGNIIISAGGDPTLGSWRYENSKEARILKNFKDAIVNAGIKRFTGEIKIDDHLWHSQTIPDGWIWQDIGNYYGAGASALNWRENQYDLVLKSGKVVGDSVKIISTVPSVVQGLFLINELTSAEKGSGDNAFIYLPGGRLKSGYLRGTIPVNEDDFVISGAMPDAGLQLKAGLLPLPGNATYNDSLKATNPTRGTLTLLYTHTSPSLDSINYWFLKKSINLYGEALLKTIALEKTGYGATDSGVNIVKNFWSKQGIQKTEINIIDGSGLSPANKITARALTTILQYAPKRSWFSYFYDALPVINGIKMKSGSIGGVLSYAGYIKSKDGDDYTFAFIINNFNGSSAALRLKMWKLLNVLK